MNTEAKLPPDDSGAEASEAWHAANPVTTPASLLRPRRLTWAEWKVAIDSGWRAGVKQFKKRRTELAKESQQPHKPAPKEQQ